MFIFACTRCVLSRATKQESINAQKDFSQRFIDFRALARKAESSACWWAYASVCASSAAALVVLVGKSGKALAMKSSLMLRALFSVSSAFGEACGGLEFIFIIFIQHPYFLRALHSLLPIVNHTLSCSVYFSPWREKQQCLSKHNISTPRPQSR